MKIIIPIVELEIGFDLYLRITDVSFIPGRPAYINGRPEDCYPEEPAECDWSKDNAHLVIKKKVFIGMSVRYPSKKAYRIDEHEFDVDDSFVYEYYDKIIEAIENGEY